MARLTDTISGAIATFRTPGKQDIRSLKVHFTPVQEGTGDPSPDNVRPISGWTGVEVYKAGKNLCSRPDGGGDYLPLLIPIGIYVTASSNLGGNVTLQSSADSSFIRYSQVSNGGNRKYEVTFDIPEDKDTYRFNRRTASQDCQLEVGTAATAYEPYTGTTLPIDWTDSAGTVYGGYVDLVTGEVWETWTAVDMGQIEWLKSSSGNKFYVIGLNRNYPWQSDLTMYCPIYKFDGANVGATYYGDDCTIRYYYKESGSQSREIYVHDERFDNATDFKTAMDGIPLVYPLATPALLTTLTPTALRTLIGTNNIWSNANGNVEVEYDFAESREMMEARKRVATFMWKRSRLPTGYREVEFIAAKNATPNISMGFSLTDELEAEVHYYNSKNEAFVFGCRGGTSTPPYCNLNVEGTGAPAMTRFDYGTVRTSDFTQKFPFKLGEFIFTFHNRIARLTSLTKHSFTQQDFSSRTFQALSRNLCLFAVNTGGTISKGDTNGTLAIYSAKFWLGGEPIRDYVPCVRKSDNVAGMYDLVSGQFYTDAKTPFVTEL